MVSRIMPEAARSESLTPDSDFFEKPKNRILGEISMPRKRMIGSQWQRIDRRKSESKFPCSNSPDCYLEFLCQGNKMTVKNRKIQQF